MKLAAALSSTANPVKAGIEAGVGAMTPTATIATAARIAAATYQPLKLNTASTMGAQMILASCTTNISASSDPIAVAPTPASCRRFPRTTEA